MTDSAILYYGMQNGRFGRKDIFSGPLRMSFVDGELRYIVCRKVEILRRVFGAVRDKNWNTIAPIYRSIREQRNRNSFKIFFVAEHVKAPIDFVWKGRIEGNVSGTVRFSMDGFARSTFEMNRIGLCVLFPLKEYLGKMFRATHIDGAVREHSFPVLIDPRQPIVDGFSRLDFRADENIGVHLGFQGDIFEMEDQRNWTDGSFKAYSTPLSLPTPRTIKKGTRIVQSVHLKIERYLENRNLESNFPRVPAGSSSAFIPLPRRIPLLGFCSSFRKQIDPYAKGLLKTIGVHHLRIDLDLARDVTSSEIEWILEQSAMMCSKVELALTLNNNRKELQRATSCIEEIGKNYLTSILIFERDKPVTSAELIGAGKKTFSKLRPELGIGGGTNLNFAELNQFRLSNADILSYPITP